MKITIAYIPEQEQEAAAIVAALLHLIPGAKVRKSDRNKPFHHVYVYSRVAPKHNEK